MKESGAERVSNIVHDSTSRIIDRLESNFKGVKPFGAVKIDPLEKIYHVEASGFLEDPTELINEFGYDATAKFFEDYLKSRSRYNA